MIAGQIQAGRKSAAPWPTAAEFNEAIQNLPTSMSDPELRTGAAAVNALGLPMPYSGGFADVYKVDCPATGNTWAVKCFTKGAAGLHDRYAEISRCLARAKLPFMVDFQYLDDGVRIGGRWYPIVKMRWIEGQNLNRFVAESLDQPRMLDQLFGLWVKLAARLRAARIAHADLQHGNVILVPKDNRGLALKLIDYDGMYVPALAGRGSGEVGHRNFQHPQRTHENIHSAEVDRFSHLAICCAIRCVREGGRPLWERFDLGENLLFTEQDFLEPAESALFHELWTLRSPDARSLVGHLALATRRPLEQTPLVEELVRDGRVRPLSPAERREVQALLDGDIAEQAGAYELDFQLSPLSESSSLPSVRDLVEAEVVREPRHAQRPERTGTSNAIAAGAIEMQGVEIIVAELVEDPAPATAPSPEQDDILKQGWAAIGRQVVRVDRGLALLAGEGNRLMHNVLRVLLVLVIFPGLPWVAALAHSHVQRQRDESQRQAGLASSADSQAREARRTAQAVLPTFAELESYRDAERSFQAAQGALAEERWANAKELFDEAANSFQKAEQEGLEKAEREDWLESELANLRSRRTPRGPESSIPSSPIVNPWPPLDPTLFTPPPPALAPLALRFDGLYVKEVSGYRFYLRFYDDRTVLAISSPDTPAEVASSLHKSNGSCSKGIYVVTGTTIRFTTQSPYSQFEYDGTIGDDSLSLATYSHATGNRSQGTYQFVAATFDSQ